MSMMRAPQRLCWFLCNRFVTGRHQDALEQQGKVFLSAAAGVSSGLACAGGTAMLLWSAVERGQAGRLACVLLSGFLWVK